MNDIDFMFESAKVFLSKMTQFVLEQELVIGLLNYSTRLNNIADLEKPFISSKKNEHSIFHAFA